MNIYNQISMFINTLKANVLGRFVKYTTPLYVAYSPHERLIPLKLAVNRHLCVIISVYYGFLLKSAALSGISVDLYVTTINI